MRVNWFIVSLVFFLMASPLVASADEEKSTPDMALIEFLGGWETEEGDWIDPFLFEEHRVEETLPDAEEDGNQDQDGFRKMDNGSLKTSEEKAEKND